MELLKTTILNCNFSNYVGCNYLPWPQDGTVALPVNPQGPPLVWSAGKNFEEVSDIPPPPPRKPWKTKLWRLEPRRLKKKKKKYDCKRAGVVILFPVIHIYWAKGERWLSGDCCTSVGPADEWRCKWRSEGGKLKPSVTLSTPRRPWCRTLQPQHIKDAAPPRLQHGTHHIPSVYIFIQTNTWLLLPRRANDKRQMCPPQRIQFDKLPLRKLLNNPQKPPE